MGSGDLKVFRGDLHIHSCLSPCADLRMYPANIAKEAKDRGLDFIGICDHNSAENVRAVKRAGKRLDIKVLGGMEITSQEEVHILALFDKEKGLRSLQEIVYSKLHGTNDQGLYGEQPVVNEDNEVVRFNKKLLIGATEISVHGVVDLIHQLGGLAVASHVDREAFGIIGQLGFIPEDLPLDAVEITDKSKKDGLELGRAFPMIVSSDAHSPDEIGRSFTRFLIKEITLNEIRRSFRGESGRKIML